MSTLTNRSSALLAGCLCLLVSATATAETRSVPMTADRWETVFGTMEFKEQNGAQAMVMSAEGAAAVNGLSFRNGTVEFDVDPAAMGAGLAFRMQGLDALELLYFRPQDDCAAKPDCVQYAPFTHQILLWDLYPHYQGSAPIRPHTWNHVKVVISGRRMNVFVNGATTPTLAIPSLQADTEDGKIALIGPGAFANFTIAPDAVEGLAATEEADPSSKDQRLVRLWQLAPFSELPDGKEPTLADLPKAASDWRSLNAERGGLVNVTRVYGLPIKRPARSFTWLRTTLTSTKSQSKTVAFGFTREAWVFVNGERVYADKNLFQPPAARKAPDGRLSLQNGSFVLPLKAGENDIAIALANNFYGWGLILRLENLDGITLARK